MPPPNEADLGGLSLFTPQLEDLFRQQIQRMVPTRESRAREIADNLVRRQRSELLAAQAQLRAQTETAIATFAASLSFALEIPGRHYSGLSNQDLFDILRENGRNFAADSRPLREHIQKVLADTFLTGRERFTPTAMKQYAADAILEWIVARFDGTQTDVSMRPLTQKWLAYKRRHGMSSRIGVANGDLAESIRESGHVIVSGA